jgi:hypothetical protein
VCFEHIFLFHKYKRVQWWIINNEEKQIFTSLVNILISESTQSGIQAHATGSTGYGIKAKTYKKIKILLPSFR